MRRTFESILILACFCSPAAAQTSETCQAQLRHLTLPATALTDYDSAPLEFLFSDHGVDIYFSTSYRRSDPLQWIRENGATVVVVYQDEAARQKQIESLRKNSSLPQRVGFPQHLENVKYSVINFFGPSGAFVRDVEYFEPKACVSSSEERLAVWMDDHDRQLWAMPGLHGIKTGPNWVTGFYSPDMIVSAKDNPTYARIHNATADKVKEYLDRNQRH